MTTWKATLAVLLIFILGTVFGVMLAVRIAPLRTPYAMPAREILGQRSKENLERALSLSPEQKNAIDKIIDDTRNELVQVRKETRPRLRQIMLEARSLIRAQLTPDQRAKFDELARENRRAINKALTR